MRWSNGRWKNTVHRVSEPSHWNEQGLQGLHFDDTAERRGSGIEAIPERYSVAWFSAPDPATVVEALSCCRRDQARRKPIHAGDHVRRKRSAMSPDMYECVQLRDNATNKNCVDTSANCCFTFRTMHAGPFFIEHSAGFPKLLGLSFCLLLCLLP